MSSPEGRGGIFISYRQKDTHGQAGRLYDKLSDCFGADRVFMDAVSIPGGADFARKILEDVCGSSVLLVLIGHEWSAITDDEGKRRIDDSGDWVRVEIETALQQNIRVIPVLVDGAARPQADDLPPSLHPLARLQTRDLRHASFQSDVTVLIGDVDKGFEGGQTADSSVIAQAVMGDQPSRVTVIRIRAPGVDVPALAEGLRLWYENQNLETSTAVTPTGLMVQCRRLQTSKRASSTDPPLAVMLRSEGEDLRVEIGSAKWLNKVTAVTILGILPAKAVMTTTRLLFELGTWRWWYYRLSNQTINFLRATAPMHVRSR